MANKRISELTLSTLDSDDVIPISRGSSNYKLNLEEVISSGLRITTFAELQDAAALTTPIRIELRTDITCTAEITLPDTMTIFYNEKKLIDGGFAVWHYATMGDMTREQKFSGFVAGDIKGTFGHGIAFPEWWGLTDDAHDIAANCATQASTRQSGLGLGLIVSFGGRIYYFSAPCDGTNEGVLFQGAGMNRTKIVLTSEWDPSEWQQAAIWAEVIGGNHSAAFWIGGAAPVGRNYFSGVVGMTIECNNASFANPTRRISGISCVTGIEEQTIIDDINVSGACGLGIGFPSHKYEGVYLANVVNGLKVGRVWITGATVRDSLAMYFPPWASNYSVEVVTVDMRVAKSSSASYAISGGFDPDVYSTPDNITDWPLIGIWANGKGTFKAIHVEGCGIGLIIPPNDANNSVTVDSLQVNNMMNRASGMVYYNDFYRQIVTAVATYAAGANTLLTVTSTNGIQVGQVLAISGANGTNAASYNTVHIVTAVPPTTGAGTIAINLAYPGAGAVPVTAGNITWNAAPDGNDVTDGVDWLGFSTAVFIGNQVDGTNSKDSVVLTNVRVIGFCCYRMRDRSCEKNISAYGSGQFPNNGLGSVAFYARGTAFINDATAPYTYSGASTTNCIGPILG